MTEELFSKRLPIAIKVSDREERKQSINVTVELQTITSPIQRKELELRLTDEADLFFLYTLRINEEDFQSLKVQQGLLVDFAAFPQKFIELLGFVLQEESRESPKFILEFVCNGGSLATSTGNLNVVETNPFKHLTHLSLKFLPGTDSDVKKYLAACLKAHKDQNAMLLHKMEHTEGELSANLRQAREALASRTLELDSLKKDWNERMSELASKHSQELHVSREQALNEKSSLQHQIDREKREIEQSYSKTIKQLEARLYESEAVNKDLTDRKYKSESTIRELKSKNNGLEEEVHRMKLELSSLRKSNAGLDSDKHEQEKLVNNLRTRLAVFEQEVKDKEAVLQKTNDLQSKDHEQLRKQDEEMEKRQKRISKLELSVKTLSQELMKGNEIIKKLQGEIRNYHTKLKLRNTVATEQEKLIGEKTRDLEAMKSELQDVKKHLKDKEDELHKLSDNLEATTEKLEESRQLLKTNENVINWLNKQVTEAQVNQQRFGTGTFDMKSSVVSSSHRAYPTQASIPRGTMSNLGLSAGSMSNTTNSLHTTPGSSVSHQMSHISSIAHHNPLHNTYPTPRSTPPQPQVQYNPSSNKATPQPPTRGSPLSAVSIPEEPRQRYGLSASNDLRSKDQTLPQQTNTDRLGSLIDDKYFQPLADAAKPPRHSNSPIPIHFAKEQVAPASSNPHRLSRDIIAPQQNIAISTSKQTAPLASAYFPEQTKVG